MAPTGPHVLLVEDETAVALLVEDMLAELGCTSQSAWRVPQALEMAERDPIDLAVLDVNVAGQSILPVAEALRRRGTPFIFASGYGSGGAPAGFPGVPVLTKPFAATELAAAMRRASGGKSS